MDLKIIILIVLISLLYNYFLLKRVNLLHSYNAYIKSISALRFLRKVEDKQKIMDEITKFGIKFILAIILYLLPYSALFYILKFSLNLPYTISMILPLIGYTSLLKKTNY